jgi:hypothetical protein
MIITIIANQLTNSDTVLNFLCDVAKEYEPVLSQSYPMLQEIIVELLDPVVSEEITLTRFSFSQDDTILKLGVSFLPKMTEVKSITLLAKEMESIRLSIMA